MAVRHDLFATGLRSGPRSPRGRLGAMLAVAALVAGSGTLVGTPAVGATPAPALPTVPTAPALSPPVVPPESPTPTPECTITGTDRADVLRGTPGDDIICGLGGADVIAGGGGHDTLVGGPGRDTLRGGVGDDALAGGPGRDSGSGGRGEDTCSADPGLVDCTVDAQAPALVDVSIPERVNAGEDLVMSWTATDATRVTSWAYVGGRNGWETWCFGGTASPDANVADGSRFVMTCPVPAVIPNGEYVVFVRAGDDFGFVTSFETTFAIVGGSDDVTPPSLIAAPDLAPVQPGDAFSVQWELADASGVTYTELWIYTPEYSLIGYDQLPGSTTTPATLVSGDAGRGVWEQSFTVSPEASSGSYLVTLSVRDSVGNRDVLVLGHIDVGLETTPVEPDPR